MNDAPEFLTGEQVAELVTQKVEDLGGPGKASTHWGCSLQMIHLARKGDRAPTKAMLRDLGLEEVKERRYRAAKGKR